MMTAADCRRAFRRLEVIAGEVQLVVAELEAVQDALYARESAPAGAVHIGLGADCPDHSAGCAVTSIYYGPPARFRCSSPAERGKEPRPFPSLAWVGERRVALVYRDGHPAPLQLGPGQD